MKKLLIVVDMQNDFVTGCLGTKEAVEITPAIAKYVQDFDGEVIFTRDTHKENYLETQEGKKLPVLHCLEGSDGWQIVPQLRGFPADESRCRFFDKPTFGSAQLAQFVSENAPEEVQLVGVCTGICVLSNAVLIKAFAPEIPVKVIANLCACVTPESHETALKAMETCQIEIIRHMEERT